MGQEKALDNLPHTLGARKGVDEIEGHEGRIPTQHVGDSAYTCQGDVVGEGGGGA
jgi:hypothetical protein